MAKTVAPPISTAVEKLAIRVGLFDFHILPVEELILPAFDKPKVLRGSFGNLFRELCCVWQLHHGLRAATGIKLAALNTNV